MDIARALAVVLIVAVSLSLLGWLCYRLLRWARSESGGAHVLGAVLTEVTQGPAVHEAKQGAKRRENSSGDPP